EGTSCGGKAEVFLEPVNKKYRLYIFGAGHVGRALAGIVNELDFDITIIDDREGIFSDWDDNVFDKITISFEEYSNIMQFDERIFITIITYDHKIDWEILSYCSEKPWHYLGMMGSRSKVKSMKISLAAKGVSEEIIERIDMPIGMEIQAETAFEIAVSIAANLITEKNILSKKLCKNVTV
ncbi:MAG: XdhC family protein, partial [Candidatus Kapabacteria bacterium]|nr:XdhC family protein [Candidatus Kapabacteria bacterium]